MEKSEQEMRQYIHNTLILIFAILLFEVNADYCATAEIKGNVCKGFALFSSCGLVQVDAVEYESKLSELNRRCFSRVDKYWTHKNKGWCKVDTKGFGSGGGVISWALNSITQPTFFHRNKNGKLKKIGVEYLKFRCIKR